MNSATGQLHGSTVKNLLACTLMAAGLYSVAGAAQAACGKVSIAEMNWKSAGIAAFVDKFVLEEGFGCSVDVVPGDTIPTFESMLGTGEPDIAPEFWVNAVRTRLDTATEAGKLAMGAEILSDGAVEGWWIPKFVADANPGMRTVQQALDRPELFPAGDDPNKGAIHSCPEGWSCRVSTANLYRALGAEEKNFKLVEPISAADLDASIARAFETKTGWLGYYWAPTPALAKYEMVKLSFDVPHDRADWDSCTTVPDCPTPKVNSYPISRAFTIVTRQFADSAPEAMEYMKNRSWTNTTVNSILAWQDENKATNEDAARHFLKTMPEIWNKWVSPGIAEKINAAL